MVRHLSVSSRFQGIWSDFPTVVYVDLFVSAAEEDYMYLMNIRIFAFTKERRIQVEKERSQRSDELYKLRQTSIQDMWRNDLDKLMETLKVCLSTVLHFIEICRTFCVCVRL